MSNPNIAVFIQDIERYKQTINNAFDFSRELTFDDLEKAIYETKEEISQYRMLESEIIDLIKTLNETKNQLINEIKSLKQDIYNTKDEISVLREGKDELYSELAGADKEEKQYIRGHIRDCNQEISEKKSELKELQRELSDKKNELYKTEKQITDSKELKSQIEENTNELSQEETKLKKILDELKAILKDAQIKMDIANGFLYTSSQKVSDYLSVKVDGRLNLKCNINSLDNFSSNTTSNRRTKADVEIETRILDSYGERAKYLIENTNLQTKQCFEQIANNLTQNQRETFYNLLEQIKEKYPDKYQAAIQYIAAKGIYAQDGIYDLKKMLKDGNLSESILSESVIEMTRRIYSSQLKKETEKIRNKNAIRLSKYKEDRIWKDPEYLRMIVEQETGKPFEEGFQEFFIRLAKSNNQFQIERIWNASQEIYRNISKENNQKAKAVIKDAIRPGGVHEWLMCENFGQFLYDTKWRKDGAFLVMLLTELVQDTENVFLENVEIWDKDKEEYVKKDIWGHNDEANKNSKYNTMGGANNPNSIIHNLIRECVENSSSAAELLVNLDQRVKAMFSEKTYEEFRRKLDECLA